MNKQFKIGQLGIANDFDRPASKMVAVIIKVDEKQIYFRYLSKEMGKSWDKIGHADFTEWTDLYSFGVICEIEGKEFRCTQTKKSTAQYSDGKIRNWQDSNPSWWHQVSEKVLPYLEKK